MRHYRRTMAAEACDLCGAATPADARFCPQCGTGLDVEVVDLTGRSTAGPASPAPRAPGANRLLVGLGAIVALALAGLWLLSGSDDQPDDADRAAPPQSDEQPGGDEGRTAPVTGATLETVLSIRPAFAEVEEVLRSDDAASVGLVHDGENLFWLTGEYVPAVWPGTDARVRGPRLLHSPDGGTTWEELRHDLPPDAAVGAMTRHAGGLAIAGNDSDGALTVWRSVEGRRWEAEPIGDLAASVGRIAIPTAIHDSPAGLIILVTHLPDIGVIEPLLPVDPSHLTAVAAGPDLDSVDFIGPMGFRLKGPSLDDPVVTDEMRTTIEELSTRPPFDHTGAIWAEGPDGWRGTAVEGRPNDLTVLADGSPLVIGFTGTGTTEWTIDETGEWSNRFASPDLGSLTSWRGQVIATGDGDLRVRSERGSWEPYGLFNALPRTLQDGFLVAAAGDSDILAVSLVSTKDGRVVSPPGPALLAKDDFVLTYDVSFGTLVVTTPSLTRIEIAPWQPSLPRGVSLDPEAPALVVTEPDGDAETVFSFNELAQLERAAATLSSLFEEAEVLVSIDGWTWARGDLPENTLATQLVPVGNSVLTVVGRLGGPGAGLATDGVRLMRVSYS